MRMLKQISFVGSLGVIVVIVAVAALRSDTPVAPIVLSLGVIPLLGLLLAGRSLKSAIPDLLFGAVDTGLLTIPALWGGLRFGVVGAIAGGVVGDAITDGIAGFFEGSVATWLRKKGIEESRDAVTSSLGKMAGCLIGAGLVLTGAFLIGLSPR